MDRPSELETEESALLLRYNRKNRTVMNGEFGAVDGERLSCAEYVDAEHQNAYYEKWTLAGMVTNLFVFNFTAEISHAALNYPGFWYDSKLASASGVISSLLIDLTPSERAVLGDSAFSFR